MATKPASKKPVKIVKATKVTRPKAKRKTDDARSVAFATDGKLNTDQIRFLRCISTRGTRMVEIKAFCGLAPDQKYSSKFLNALHDLVSSRMVRIEREQDSRAFVYFLTDKGKTALTDATKSARVIAKVRGE